VSSYSDDGFDMPDNSKFVLVKNLFQFRGTIKEQIRINHSNLRIRIHKKIYIKSFNTRYGHKNTLNLIITCARHLESETKQEVSIILEKMGDSESSINITNMSGILTAEIKLEPIEVIKKIKEMILDEPWCIRYCLRVIPIQKITDTSIESIEKGISDLIKLISNEESYRISIEKRNSNISSQEIISRIAKKIKNKVSLEFPDKVILIEILGNKTGIAIVKKTDILSVEKTKRSLSD